MNVFNAGTPHALLQLLLIELRIVPRPWHRANIDQSLNRVGLEHAQELVDRVGRMANRIDGFRFHVSG